MNTQMQQEIVEGSRKNTSSYFKKYQEILGKDNDGNTIYSIDDKEVIEGIMTDVDNYEDGLLDYMKSIYTEE